MDVPKHILRDRVLANSSLFAKLFLVRPWVTGQDLVHVGVADSELSAESILHSLQKDGLIETTETGYTCRADILQSISDFLPVQNDAEAVQRTACVGSFDLVSRKLFFVKRETHSAPSPFLPTMWSDRRGISISSPLFIQL